MVLFKAEFQHQVCTAALCVTLVMRESALLICECLKLIVSAPSLHSSIPQDTIQHALYSKNRSIKVNCM